MRTREGKMATLPVIYNVLFATDFSPASMSAFSYAVEIANPQSKLIVAHVVNPDAVELLDDEPARVLIEDSRKEATRRISAMLEPLHLPRDRYEIVVAQGVIYEALVDIIDQYHIDIAVLGTHGRRAFKKLLMGSVAEEVFRMAPCPVLTVGLSVTPAGAGALKHILYPVQYAPDSSSAARYAVSLAERYGANLTVMNVSEDMRGPANAAGQPTDALEHWTQNHVPQGSELRNRIRLETGFGPAADSILEFAGKASVDLIVMGVRRLDPVIAAHLPKSETAYELVSRARCPVLTIGDPSI
jgi:nucleotide-binding universal stress UspA family protein